jgi:hypothetical protein
LATGNREKGIQTASGVLPAFSGRMRRFLAIAIAFQFARIATASTLPLTGKEIALMLKAGYSSETILRDLNARHFAGPLDPSSEAELRQLNASPKLLDDLKSGRFDATADQLTQAQQKVAAIKAEAKELARQQQIALQNVAARQSTSTQVQQWKERPQAAPKIIDLQIGQMLDLREFDGPNMRVGVLAVEMDALIIGLADYDHMQVVGGGYIDGGYGGSVSIHSEPTATRKRVEKEDKALLYRWGRTKLVYLDVMDVAQNHVKVGIVSE